MSRVERETFLDKATEFSKKVDKYTILVGAGMFAVGASFGALLVIGSVMTYIPADMIQKRKRKK